MTTGIEQVADIICAAAQVDELIHAQIADIAVRCHEWSKVETVEQLKTFARQVFEFGRRQASAEAWQHVQAMVAVAWADCQSRDNGEALVEFAKVERRQP
jgi:hypothetical protein